MEEIVQDYPEYAIVIKTNTEQHVSEVESGRKGYLCIACKRELVAHHGFTGRKKHFKHYADNKTNTVKCTFKNETYRHKIAKEILQRLKQIKTPILFKYPPKNVNGNPYLLKSAETIHAHSVDNELQFYQNENGKICWGKNINFKINNEKHFLFQPDVAFFNEKNEPILLIELVATHKITDKKLIDIQCLGINAIQIRIPKESAEEIEKTLTSTSNSKWLYNYEQEREPYNPISIGTAEAIFPIDEFERKRLNAIESFSCKSSRINTLIRAVRNFVDSEQFGIAKRKIEDEIGRIESNCEGEATEIGRIQSELRKGIEGYFEPENRGIELRRKQIEVDNYSEQEKFRLSNRDNRIEIERIESEYRKLEKRYNIKNESLRIEQVGINKEEGEFKPNTLSEIAKFEGKMAEVGILEQSIEDRIEEIRRDYSRVEGNHRAEKIELDLQITSIENRRGTISEEFRKREKNLRSELNEKYEVQFRNAVYAIENKIVRGDSELNRRIKKIIDGRDLLSDFWNEKLELSNIKKAEEYFESEVYKSWD